MALSKPQNWPSEWHLCVFAGNTDRRLARRVSQLFAGLVLYGISMAFMIESGLGLNPWDVFHQGLSEVTGISFGWVVILVGIPVLLLWIPLRQKPGFGTIANLVVIGLVVDGALAVLRPGRIDGDADHTPGRRHRSSTGSPPASTSAATSARARATA